MRQNLYSFSRIVMPEDKAFFTSNNSCDRTLTILRNHKHEL
ncbi:hypothetical protein BMETH_471_0 [methanotrophic bacterial endosymbiont of Bathymodiolus sp.]|nr:hypothetical protein BMETH_471_0 [methanotrophic bacterial endosymbiont of Bathymodiolus sp.]